ncbi:MAG TPA: biopolymer transporter ExbD, partial [Polyangiaceae bacterium]|nr:biopolymer transporter ExbD [Polyangiaceae bacterium]
MAMGPGPARGMKADINVTPLVDVVLVLLIIFMVVTPMLQRGKEVDLPKAAKTDEENKQVDPLVLSITPDHKVWLE